MKSFKTIMLGTVAAVTLAVTSQLQATPILWDSPMDIPFTKANNADWTLLANQDWLTPNVALTRGNNQGIFNIAQETHFTGTAGSSLSPVGTEWAYGSLADYSSLTFQRWAGFNGANPPSMVGKPAVLHLINEDIYLSIQFTSWGIGDSGTPDNGFSYVRSVPEPGTLALLGLGCAGLLFLRRRK